MTFRDLWNGIAPIGLSTDSGGYLRYAWTDPELALRDWFRAQAHQRELTVDEDGNGSRVGRTCTAPKWKRPRSLGVTR